MKRPLPSKYSMDQGEIKYIQGSGANLYEVEYVGSDVFSCNCPSWKFQKGVGELRTCKHVVSIIGAVVDAERMMCVTKQPTLHNFSPKKKAKAASGTSSSSTGATSASASLNVEQLHSLAHPFKAQNVACWVVSEKLDGMRCIYINGAAFSRAGNEIRTPAGFFEGLSKHACLDGELFLGRGGVQDCVSIVKRHSATMEEWAPIKFMVFDAPKTAGGILKSRGGIG